MLHTQKDCFNKVPQKRVLERVMSYPMWSEKLANSKNCLCRNRQQHARQMAGRIFFLGL